MSGSPNTLSRPRRNGSRELVLELGVSRNLLDHVPPEIRKKVVEQARSNGPRGAAAAVNAAALKTRNLKVKLALKTLGGLLKLLDSKDPKK